MSSPLRRKVRTTDARVTRTQVANASVASAIALGVVGVLVGTGVASTAIGVSDGMTWLTDAARGEILQYNPSTKRIERAYKVAQPGDVIEISQDSGIVSIENGRTGELLTVDMSKMRAAGARAIDANSKVLVAKGMMVLVDAQTNTLTRIDPIRADDLGEPWTLPRGTAVADAAADRQGTVWVVSNDGVVRGLEWDRRSQRFLEVKSKKVDKVADDAELVAHPEGVTVFGPRAGVIAQVGTPSDTYQQSNQLIGVASATTESPADLVPGALKKQSAVAILDRGRVRQVSTAALGCARPISPTAFNETVYVVCEGSQKVIRLTRDGRVAGPEIRTPGPADAEPIADEGRLVLNVSGASQGIEIDRSGAPQLFDRQPLGGTQTVQVQPDESRQGLKVGRDQARDDLRADPAPSQGATATTRPSTRVEGRTEVVGEDTRPASTPAPSPVVPAPAPSDIDRESDSPAGPAQDDPRPSRQPVSPSAPPAGRPIEDDRRPSLPVAPPTTRLRVPEAVAESDSVQPTASRSTRSRAEMRPVPTERLDASDVRSPRPTRPTVSEPAQGSPSAPSSPPVSVTRPPLRTAPAPAPTYEPSADLPRPRPTRPVSSTAESSTAESSTATRFPSPEPPSFRTPVAAPSRMQPPVRPATAPEVRPTRAPAAPTTTAPIRPTTAPEVRPASSAPPARPTTAPARPTTLPEVRPTTVPPVLATDAPPVRPTTAQPPTARPTTARPPTARPTTAQPTRARPTAVRPTTAPAEAPTWVPPVRETTAPVFPVETRPAPTRPAGTSDPVPSDPVPTGPVPTAPATQDPEPTTNPAPSRSQTTGPRPTPEAVPPTGAVATPTPTAASTEVVPTMQAPAPTTPASTRPSAPETTDRATVAPTTAAPEPAPQPTSASTTRSLASPSNVRASRLGLVVTVSWSHPGADYYIVRVGGLETPVLGIARVSPPMPVTGWGGYDVEVIAVRGSERASSAASVAPMTSPTPSPRPAPSPEPRPSVAAPATPSGLSATHSGTMASVRFNPVSGATGYTITCNDVGSADVTDPGGEVTCGPDSEEQPVHVAVRARNATGNSGWARITVQPS